MLGYVRYKPKLSYCSSSSGYHCYKSLQIVLFLRGWPALQSRDF